MPGSEIILYVTGTLCIIGAVFTLIAAIGVLRLNDLYMRMHAASKAGTLGSCVILIAIAIFSGESEIVLRALAGVIFFLLTAPISAHLLARAAYTVGYQPCSLTTSDALSEAGKSLSSAKTDSH
ncbi:monovalent cation/H(+) antiporter subunit G [Acuticoccus sp. MNP-M23]|uniref:monovalent cation/H(+) antiporter subunit G n=1 Tax=Acuticoccus sp. MNP-M23 TaxID=3072793 RepID=UPI002814E1B8|nr:monovalent cation/H(+) antiporter subunit G [Acuticoccus sp. MNP-M23]WMS42036.1 monovalent cation/H(+) antiporter subunit G [Acuticoccus sp. MNP-M23]